MVKDISDPHGNENSETEVHVVVPSNISSPIDLIELIGAKLQFPRDFGRNWNALFDCLCDLKWLRERRIVISHDEMPAISVDQWDEYVRVLLEAADSWHGNESEHEIVVVLPWTEPKKEQK